VDTSAWYALIDARDPDHDNALSVLKAYEGRLVTTNFILDETITLIRYRLGWRQAHQFGQAALKSEIAHLVRTGFKDEEAAWEIFTKYRDKAFSFTDCTSFAIAWGAWVSKPLLPSIRTSAALA
jgi:predicted nucleic acid-binding protein